MSALNREKRHSLTLKVVKEPGVIIFPVQVDSNTMAVQNTLQIAVQLKKSCGWNNAQRKPKSELDRRYLV